MYRLLVSEFVVGCRERVPFHTSTVHFGAGALAGMAAATLTHPFDVVKTRRQMLTQVCSRVCVDHFSTATTNQSTDSSASGSTSMFRIARELVKVCCGDGLLG